MPQGPPTSVSEKMETSFEAKCSLPACPFRYYREGLGSLKEVSERGDAHAWESHGHRVVLYRHEKFIRVKSFIHLEPSSGRVRFEAER